MCKSVESGKSMRSVMLCRVVRSRKSSLSVNMNLKLLCRSKIKKRVNIILPNLNVKMISVNNWSRSEVNPTKSTNGTTKDPIFLSQALSSRIKTSSRVMQPFQGLTLPAQSPKVSPNQQNYTIQARSCLKLLTFSKRFTNKLNHMKKLMWKTTRNSLLSHLTVPNKKMTTS